MLGLKKCPNWLKDAYKKAVGYKCEQCGKEFKSEHLEIHRIRQGQNGGTYKPSNCQVLCKEHHKIRTITQRRASGR